MEHIALAEMAQAMNRQDLDYVAANRNTFVGMMTNASYFGSLLLTQYAYYLTGDTKSLLEDSCEQGHCDIVDWFLTEMSLNKDILPEDSLDKNILPKDILPKDILYHPAYGGHMNVLISLIKAGANIDGEGSFNPLLGAVLGQQIDIIYQLYIYGADMSVSFGGNNALHYACYRNYYDIVKILLNLGVPNEPNDEDLMPIEIATDPKIKALFQ